MSHRNIWTDSEESFLRENFGKLSFAEIACHLGRGEKAVQSKTIRMGLGKGGDPTCNAFWTASEDEYLIENYRILPIKEIAQNLKRSIKSVSGRAERLKITQPNDFWTDEKIQFIKNWYGKISNQQLAEFFEKEFGEFKSIGAIQKRASKYKLLANPFHNANRHFFDAPDLINSYYAGLIASDGCIDDSSNTKTMKIELHHLDTAILELFAKDANFTGAIKAGSRNSSVLRISCCQEWFPSLRKNFSITPRKCKTKIPKNAETILQPPSDLIVENAIAFLIGLIDGDGSVGIHCNYRKPNPYFGFNISIHGSEPIVNWSRNLIEKVLDDSELPLVSPCSTVFRFSLTGKKAENLGIHLMSIKTPKLMRKWVIAKAWINKDLDIIKAYIENRGKKMSAWKGVLKVLESRGITPEIYYYEQ